MSKLTWIKRAPAARKRSAAAAFAGEQGEDSADDGDRVGGNGEGTVIAGPGGSIKVSLLKLEDPETRFRRLKSEGAVLAEQERFWQAIHLWDQVEESHAHAMCMHLIVGTYGGT